MRNDPIAVIGAGPYGLSIAAHLQSRGLPAVVFGKTMAFWQNMPDGMHLKSVWSASSLSDPQRAWSLDRYSEAMAWPAREPIPLPDFVAYGQWFARQARVAVDPAYVQTLVHDGDRFLPELDDGRRVSAWKVIVATGIQSFAVVPDFAQHLPSALASHTQAHNDFARFKGRTVAVLGRGQSAVQTAAFLHEAGAANVELIARGPIVWIARRLYAASGPLKHVFYPPSDVGPPGLNWLIHFPSLYRQLPVATRAMLEGRAIRPAGAPWLRQRVEGLVRETPGVEISRATPQGEQLRLDLSDGTRRVVDHLFLATGYRARLDALSFLHSDLGARVSEANGFPLLNQWFESSVPNLHFAGAIASYNFGPICRFVSGAPASARQITRHAERAMRQPTIEVAGFPRDEVAVATRG